MLVNTVPPFRISGANLYLFRCDRPIAILTSIRYPPAECLTMEPRTCAVEIASGVTLFRGCVLAGGHPLGAGVNARALALWGQAAGPLAGATDPS